MDVKRTVTQSYEHKICSTCGNEIDPECCWCGSSLEVHGLETGHSFVPMGCTCYMKTGEEWDPEDGEQYWSES